MSTETIVRVFTSTGKPSRIYPAGRVCEAPGCGTILSQYTPGPTCHMHTPVRPVIGDGVRERGVTGSSL